MKIGKFLYEYVLWYFLFRLVPTLQKFQFPYHRKYGAKLYPLTLTQMDPSTVRNVIPYILSNKRNVQLIYSYLILH